MLDRKLIASDLNTNIRRLDGVHGLLEALACTVNPDIAPQLETLADVLEQLSNRFASLASEIGGCFEN